MRGRSAGLRLCLPRAIANNRRVGVSLVALKSKRPCYLNLPNAAQLRSYLSPPLMPWVDKWEQLLARYPQAQPDGPGRLRLNVESGAVSPEDFVAAFADLATQVRLL